MRHSDSDILLDSDRGLIELNQVYPYSPAGNIIPFTGGSQVDPVLSARAGRPVTVVALNGNPTPTAADLLSGANHVNSSEVGSYRSLISASRPYEASLAGNKTLTPWLSLSVNGSLTWSDGQSLRGLPTGRFLISADNAYTPFSTPVFLALSDPTRPIESSNHSNSKSFTATFNANFAGWHMSFVGSYNDRNSRYVSDIGGTFPLGYYPVGPAVNPFSSGLAGLIPIDSTLGTSHNIDRQFSLDGEGPVFKVPAGQVVARYGASILWNTYETNDFRGAQSRDRRETQYKAGVTIPLTGELPARDRNERTGTRLGNNPAQRCRLDPALFGGAQLEPHRLAADYGKPVQGWIARLCRAPFGSRRGVGQRSLFRSGTRGDGRC